MILSKVYYNYYSFYSNNGSHNPIGYSLDYSGRFYSFTANDCSSSDEILECKKFIFYPYSTTGHDYIIQFNGKEIYLYDIE